MNGHAASEAETSLPPLGEGAHRKRIGLISVVACLGGLLFGYDTGVANGAEQRIELELGLTAIQLGVVISSLVFAAAVGALFGGRISDAIGRRRTILILAVLFFVGVVLVVVAPGGPGLLAPVAEGQRFEFQPTAYWVIVLGRIIIGLAVGGASTVVPVFLAELAPYEIRGSITGRNELAIVTGQFLAFLLNAIIATVSGDVAGVWRIMFGVCALPAVALFIGMLRMPESPRWLVEKGRDDEALAVLRTIRSDERALAELQQVETVAEEEQQEHVTGLKAILTNKWLLRILLVGIGISMTQQLTGINAIMYFGTRVLEESGMSAQQAMIANIAFGAVAVLGGIYALRNMDKVGRRKTFLTGLSLTTFFHLLIGIASFAFPEGNAIRPLAVMILVTGFVLSMQAFLNIAVWVWLAEIFPLHMRGLGIGVAVFFGWSTNGLLALFFPTLVAAIGITGSFGLFAVIGLLALGFVWRHVPETQGRSLEALEEDVISGEIYVDTPNLRTLLPSK
jgi:major inositol transporter-like SP family MFS transporter